MVSQMGLIFVHFWHIFIYITLFQPLGQKLHQVRAVELGCNMGILKPLEKTLCPNPLREVGT